MPALLSINNYYYRRGGAEVVFLEENRMFEALGWDVACFAMHHENNYTSPWSRYFVDEIEFGVTQGVMKKIASAGKIIFSYEARDKILRLVEDIRPDVAHAHNVYHHISPSIFGALRAQGIPTVLTLHDLKIACPAYKMLAHDGICERCRGGALWNVLFHRCVKDSLPLSAVIMAESFVHRFLGCYSRHVDRFVVPSRFYLDKLVEWGWPAESFEHIPNFVDVEAFQPSGKPGDRFIFFGRLGHEKGVATFVQALALSGTRGVVVGTGPEEERLRALAAKLGADVEFLGYRSGQALIDAISAARAMVLPSEWYENAPMSVLEAYALERPVLGADIGGIPELIRPESTGDVFVSGVAESLAERLDAYASLPVEAVHAMGVAGRRWVEDAFTATRYRDRLLDLYRRMGVRC